VSRPLVRTTCHSSFAPIPNASTVLKSCFALVRIVQGCSLKRVAAASAERPALRDPRHPPFFLIVISLSPWADPGSRTIRSNPTSPCWREPSTERIWAFRSNLTDESCRHPREKPALSLSKGGGERKGPGLLLLLPCRFQRGVSVVRTGVH